MNRRDVRAVPVDDKMAVTIKKVGVIGSGQMGNGIAHVAALAGFDVVLNDRPSRRTRAKRRWAGSAPPGRSTACRIAIS